MPGLGVIPAEVRSFSSETKTVPHMGWNGATPLKSSSSSISPADASQNDPLRYGFSPSASYYFVHSFRAAYTDALKDWALTVTQYGDEVFVSSVQKDNVFATQFHPEKSGQVGLDVLKAWLSLDSVVNEATDVARRASPTDADVRKSLEENGLTKRVVACLDVRTNDAGDLVVTKGDQYDVREADPTSAPATGGPSTSGTREVRNLGKPVDLAKRYFAEGADEVTFLNITSFRSCPLHDQPMLEVVRKAAETVFVPLCIGGGIRDTVDPDGTKRSALEVAAAYFRAGADKVSIGSDAVTIVEELLASGGRKTGKSGIEEISRVYGSQAVVVSVDPRRVYVASPEDAPDAHRPCVVDLGSPVVGSSASQPAAERPENGPNGERYCWYQCTIKGGRESRPLDVVQLSKGVEALGAGEILLNSVDRDGSKAGFDLRLVKLVRDAVSIPVIASSGAGKPEDFVDVFKTTNVEAALAAGIFHRKEVPLEDVKAFMAQKGVKTRRELPVLPA